MTIQVTIWRQNDWQPYGHASRTYPLAYRKVKTLARCWPEEKFAVQLTGDDLVRYNEVMQRNTA